MAFRLIRSDELQKMELPPTRWIVEQILPEGLTVVAGAPKSGKSWLMLDMAMCVSSGKPFFGFQTHKSKVVYFDLESSARRSQERQRLIEPGCKGNSDLLIVTGDQSIPKLGEGFEEQLQELIEQENPACIILDVLQKIRPVRQLAYSADYDDLSRLQQIANTNHISVLCVTHTRKMIDPADVFANINGTNGISGTADTCYMLTKDKRFSDKATFSVMGREVEANEYILQFNNYRWINLGDREQIAFDEFIEHPLTQTVKELVSQYPTGWTGTASMILETAELMNIEDAAEFEARHAGRFFTEHKSDFERLGIRITRPKRNMKSRPYCFTKM